MHAVAVIPARGGSKGIPRKNVRPLCGKPLIAWTIESALNARKVERVVVSTDDPEIAQVSAAAGAEVIWRPQEISGDTAPSEAALIHALDKLKVRRGPLAFLQCTSPLTLPEDIDGTLGLLEIADSSFTAAPAHRFLWRGAPDDVVPFGHSKLHRPMRQERANEYVEVGAVYAVRVERFLDERTRFAGRTALYPIPPERSVEIDTETDFLLAETLMRRRLQAERAYRLPTSPQALVMDFDGVLTNNRVRIDQFGTEAVECHRGDGWAIRRLKEMGIKLLVLTNEKNPVVQKRCDKLGVECIVTDEKLSALQQWLARHGIAPKSAMYMGNDDPDIPCMLHVGCGIAPRDAYEGAKRAAQVVLESAGGDGCVRELTEALLSG